MLKLYGWLVLACHFSLLAVHPGALLVLSQSVEGGPKVRGRPIAHTWSPKSALRRETLPTMGDRRMVFGDGLEDIKVDGKRLKFKVLSFERRIVFLGQCHPTVEVGRVDFLPDLSSSDQFYSSGFLD